MWHCEDIVIHLSVNINKIATLRNSRGESIPDLIEYARLILDCGAHGLTIHPRSDERHITASDIPMVKSLLVEYNKKSGYREFNIEGEPSERFLNIVTKYKPDQVTLVPVKPGEITSDHGFRFPEDEKNLQPYIKKIRDEGMRVSLFVEAGVKNLGIAKKMGADRIELYTGPFAFAFDKSPDAGKILFEKYEETARIALEEGLEINAGHDLDEKNLAVFRSLPGLQEVSIGHRLLSSALRDGIPAVIKSYLDVLNL